MPKEDIDYSNTIIYKIYCKDLSIHNIYVGHTTNFIQRKYQHKMEYNSTDNKLPIYNTIRSNGGWKNWDIIELAKYNCKDHNEAIIKESEHYKELNISEELQNDIKNAKKRQKTPNNFTCEYCYFNCSKLSDLNRHMLRPKHLYNEKRYKMIQNDTIKTPEISQNKYICECGNSYQYISGLYRHKKKCKEINNDIMPYIDSNTQLTPKLVIQLIEQNKELQQTLIDQNKTIIELAQKTKSYNTTNTNCGNNNKTFNLQVFLNETCKDAINMTDFVNQIQVSLSELEFTSNIGYAEGISKVFIKNLNDIDYSERPLHCSDFKRETIYIKDDNQWTKDDENKTSLMKAIKQVANKNIKKISEWQKLHPTYADPDSKDNDKYMKIVLNSMSGSTKEESEKNYEKIAKNITKEIVINKTNLP